MNENENRMEPQAPDTEMEINNDMLESASGGADAYSWYVYYNKRTLKCCSCSTLIKTRAGGSCYCPMCKKPAYPTS